MVSLASCGNGEDGASASGLTRYAELRAGDQPLRADFNRDRNNVRLLFLVDPICPGCLRGLADMGDDLLSTLPKGARVSVFVVYEPVIGGKAKDIPAAAALLKTSAAHLYWNSSGDFGREMSHALGYWNGNRWVYAWDTWLVYPPGEEWTDRGPPQTALIMHQLGALEGNPKFPFLDVKVFAAKVRSLMADNAARQPLQ